jgi:DNA-binding Lrp family transcriptional regulator
MDDTDRKILERLRADGREPVASLASTLKVSRGTVQNRIDRMVERGDILGFTVRTRPDEDDGRVRAIMTVEITGERHKKVMKALRGLPEVAAIHTTNGRWDLVVELDTESLASFSRTLDAIRLIDGVSATETSLLLTTLRL